MANEATSIGRMQWMCAFGNDAIASSTPGTQLDNLALSGGSDFWLKIAPTASINLTGIVAPTIRSQWLLATNTAAIGSGFNLTLKHNVTSTAANRIYTPGGADFVLGPGESAWLIYDATTDLGARWRVIAGA